MTHEYVMVLTTLPADADGAAFARALVEERLAACVNLLAPMESIYRWDGEIETKPNGRSSSRRREDRVAALWDRVANCIPTMCRNFWCCRSWTATTRTCDGWRESTSVNADCARIQARSACARCLR